MATITATGRLLIEPKGRFGSVPSSRGWAVIEASMDWYNLTANDARSLLPGVWRMVMDSARGEPKGSATPRLAVVRPQVQPPAWGPHVSVSRGEQVSRNHAVWGLLRQRSEHIVNRDAATYFLSEAISKKEANIRAREQVGGTGKHADAARAQCDAAIREADTLVQRHTRTIATADAEVPRLEALLDRARAPTFLTQPFVFTFDPTSMQWFRDHFAANVACSDAREVRLFFGMPRTPRVPFHLTMVVK